MRPTLMIRALWFVLLVSHATAAAADNAADTLALGLTDASFPVVALEPGTSTPHAAWVSNGTLFHAWPSASGWQNEVVATGLAEGTARPYDGVDLRLGTSGKVALVYRRAGRLECAQRVAGVWQPAESLAVVPGALPPALAMSPVTNEPLVVWAQRGAVGEPYSIRLARRTLGGWSTQTLDTTSRAPLAVGVSVDSGDRPRVMWSRLRADGRATRVLVCALASGPAGPFAIAPVDSDLAGYSSLALDPISGEPRIAYQAMSATNARSVRYAAHTAAGAWDTVMVLPSYGTSTTLALASGPAGDPFLATTIFNPIAPQDALGGGRFALQACGAVFAKGEVRLLHRLEGTGTAPFEAFDIIHQLGVDDLAMGVRALDVDGSGFPAVGWRSPSTTCAPFLVGFTRSAVASGVGPRAGSLAALRPLVPNPVRLGAPWQLSWSLARAASVSLTIHDAAGRRVGERTLGKLEAGLHTTSWRPAVPRAGLYWLSLRADGAAVATRAAVVVR